MTIRIEVDDKKLKELVVSYLREHVNWDLRAEEVAIKVRSKQNYRNQEWEVGEFLAVLERRE